MKKYELVVTQEDDGSINVAKRNDGFDAFQIIGFLSWAQQDIIKQTEKMVNPDKVTREYVEQNPLI